MAHKMGSGGIFGGSLGNTTSSTNQNTGIFGGGSTSSGTHFTCNCDDLDYLFDKTKKKETFVYTSQNYNPPWHSLIF